MLRNLQFITRLLRSAVVPVPAPGKPRVRIRPDGWIVHAPGPFPFAGLTVIETIDQLGKNAPSYAREWPAEWWRHQSTIYGRNILAYRIIRAVDA